MRARSVVAAMALAFVSMAFLLERLPPAEASPFAWLLRQEPVHLVAHSLLYGALAIALVRWWLPPSAFEMTRRARALRALGATVCFFAVAATQELVQALHRGHLWGSEELFDLFVDGVAACAGLIVWTRFERRRQWSVARALGAVLHPAVLGPLGVFALTWSATHDRGLALRWTLWSVLAVAPVAAVWLVGLRRGWFSDHDLSVRRERPAFLAAALAMAGVFAWGVYASGAPGVVRGFALAGLVASALVTAATVAGLKVSGHAAVPVGVVALLEATSHRGLWPFAMAALAVSWARIHEGRHTPREVAAGWSIAGASGLLARWVV
jgi:hypothetical protein